MKHAILGASSAHRWMHCPGSVALCQQVPNYSSPYADEGTDAHTLGELCLNDGTNAADHLGQVMPKGNEVDEDMADAVQIYLDLIRKDQKKGDSLAIEHKFDLSNLHPDMFGTNDACIYKPKEKRLQVYDYKHGAGKPVEVEANPQLLYYALGAALSESRPLKTVELVIVQPRCPHSNGPVRRWEVDAVELVDWSSELLKAAERTKDPDAPLVPGDYCGFCQAAAICPRLYEKAIELAQDDFAPWEEQDPSYDPAELAEKLEWLDVIDKWAKNVRQFAYNEAMHGRTPPGQKLVQKRATRKYRSDVTEPMHIQDVFIYLSDDEVAERKLRSPAQLEKLIKQKFKGKAKTDERNAELARLDELVVKESTGFTLVPESDKREPVAAGPEADFSAVE